MVCDDYKSLLLKWNSFFNIIQYLWMIKSNFFVRNKNQMADQFADLFSRIIQQQQQQQRDEEDESEEEANPGDLFQHIFNQHPLFTNHVGGVIQFPINQHGRHPHRNRGGRFPQHDDNSLVRTDNTLT